MGLIDATYADAFLADAHATSVKRLTIKDDCRDT